MADIINLRRARKEKAKESARNRADHNRLIFGQTRHEKKNIQAEKKKAEEHLDSHLLVTSQEE